MKEPAFGIQDVVLQLGEQSHCRYYRCWSKRDSSQLCGDRVPRRVTAFVSRASPYSAPGGGIGQEGEYNRCRRRFAGGVLCRADFREGSMTYGCGFEVVTVYDIVGIMSFTGPVDRAHDFVLLSEST